MKPTSPLSLLLFLTLTTAAPLPILIPSQDQLPKDCVHYTACAPWLRETFSPTNDHTPLTRLPPNAHFPEHQLHPSSSPEAHRQIEEEAFNNAAVTPPAKLPPSIALSASRPLHSSYLLSLSHPLLTDPQDEQEASSASEDALPSKPTASLPALREEDTLRYWATIPADSPVSAAKEDGVGKTSCGDHSKTGSEYVWKVQPIIMAREYSDLLVVAIVVLFLAAVVVMEAVEYFGNLRSAIWCRNSRRGEIFLEDDEKAPLGGKKSFCLHPASTKCTTSLGSVKEDGEKAAVEEYHD